MSDRDTSPTRLNVPADVTSAQAAGPTPPDTEGAPPDPALGDTVGTGTAIAFGCIGATLFLILLGLIIIGITQFFG